MDEWGNRELRTKKLVRLCAGYLLERKISAQNIYGLCKLTWITRSSDAKNGSYIRSTKLPALSDVFDEDFLNYPYDEVGKRITELTRKRLVDINSLIYEGTGYTNCYNAYRISFKKWIEDNIHKIKPLISKGYNIKNDAEAESIVNTISNLPKIPKGNNSPGEMSPEFILTPLFFSLDKRLRFPLINGNKGVAKILKQLHVHNQPLIKQFKAISSLIGKGEIQSSIDIDRLGGELPDFVSFNGKAPKRKKLKQKTEKELNLKDEKDVTVIQKALSKNARRLHNTMTNLLLKKLPKYELHEGNSKENMFDVLVKNIYPELKDLLIEVKSSANIADARMAVGQLMDYSRQLENYKNTYKAVFVPEKPDGNVLDFLNFHDFKLMWIEGNEIYTNSKGLPFEYIKI